MFDHWNKAMVVGIETSSRVLIVQKLSMNMVVTWHTAILKKSGQGHISTAKKEKGYWGT